MSNKIPTIVLGGTGYVAGELLRLIAGHPQLELAAAVSTSQAGNTIKSVFPHLQNAFGEQSYITQDEAGKFLQGEVALFSAAPHGASAALIAKMLKQADQNNCKLTVVDVSADFRYPDADSYEAVYGTAHGAPELLEQFSSGLPEHMQTDTPHIGHPGCFATAMLLGAVPLLDMQLTDNSIHAFGITGSTGSGRSPITGTHHPLRHSNLYAYKPLAHRHAPEVSGICAQVTGTKPVLSFIPHSGPFARGIHMTLTANLKKELSNAELHAKFAHYYAGKPFIEIVASTPRIKDVAGSNYAHIGIATEGSVVAVFIAIDNLVKGAAGGAIQWMNLQLKLEETAGLTVPGPGWI
ncbi:MAG: N-acetyl-gamma-glutamyl-phosphate reductase [Gammaproteobacteria bacterium]|nr:N-acetyl-gamma-glutamyl-phosphate reductase [Gammaproteobacteria bacterium]MCP4091663.1 N-acetyl-gamma-glutamyl-phosphate reductase [Gammaproteobacteria bacterium]MCP4276159.1 N-acetyl-gamma-glutamyl-phosphate reductase [Gammaproteobacteria bacterium]MCP4831793.1 N-acetyl-gamma-glutamyl-phosphate reductase [Gammaproteobacteria bacterium]MCP4929729.1 N-acetyl-gamma-glutamyl-phosphate reductase [Gammaproteobacteria bacterium]